MISPGFARFGLIFANLLSALALACAACAGAANAQDRTGWGRSYINPFPGTSGYRVTILGDRLAHDLVSGANAALAKTANLTITEQTVANSGLARPDYFDWDRKIGDLIKTAPFEIAIIMIGSTDRRSIRTASGYFKFGTEDWRKAYGHRVEALIGKLKKAGVAIYWLGLPVMREAADSAAAEALNQVFREKAYVNGVKFIDTWNGFVDQFGKYSDFGPDITGQNARLRDVNGVDFTAAGSRKLASFFESQIRRDLEAARRERTIPLAGDEPQQEALIRKSAAASDKEVGLVVGERLGKVPGKAGDKTAAKTDGTKKARQAQPKSPWAARQAVVPSNYTPPGELIASDIAGGLTVLATISPVNALGPQAFRQQLPLTQRLYYKVLVRGESLAPQPGRTDDFRWPPG